MWERTPVYLPCGRPRATCRCRGPPRDSWPARSWRTRSPLPASASTPAASSTVSESVVGRRPGRIRVVARDVRSFAAGCWTEILLKDDAVLVDEKGHDTA